MSETKSIFKIGDVVYLKSDLLKKCPMSIEEITTEYNASGRVFRVACAWLSSSKTIKNDSFLEPQLTK